jgi:hypothetical protein
LQANYPSGRISTLQSHFWLVFPNVVVTVAHRHHLSSEEVSVDFGVPEGTLPRSMKQADVDSETKDGYTATGSAEGGRYVDACLGRWRRRFFPLWRHISRPRISQTTWPPKVPDRAWPTGRLGSSGQAYYPQLRDPVSGCDLTDAHIVDPLINVHGNDNTFGIRLLADDLEHNDISIGERCVWQLYLHENL